MKSEDCPRAFAHSYVGAPTNGDAWTVPSYGTRSTRGGNWINDEDLWFTRSAVRSNAWDRGTIITNGFRPAKSIGR